MSSSSRARPPRVARVLLRLPAGLHRDLAAAARTARLSFNEFCVRRLAAPVQADESSAVRAAVLARARAVVGARLAGVLALGSWARGEAGASSDIDVLVVIDRDAPLTRDLYRVWDAQPLEAEGRVVDAHFTHLAAEGAVPSAMWCEAAVDGLVWFDRDGRLQQRLAEVRRAIADGRLVRGVVHGQPYWKGVA